jgi:hypothetical protein
MSPMSSRGCSSWAATALAQFHNRFYRLTNSRTSVVTFGDAASGELPWLTLESSYDDSQIWNEARITRTGGTEQVATNATSQAAYFARTLTRTLPLLTDTEALALAQWLVALYALADLSVYQHHAGRPDGRSAVAVYAPAHDQPAHHGQAAPAADHARDAADCYVESVAHDIEARENGTFWRVTFGLSSAEALAGSSFWILQDATYGVLRQHDPAGLLGAGLWDGQHPRWDQSSRSPRWSRRPK